MRRYIVLFIFLLSGLLAGAQSVDSLITLLKRGTGIDIFYEKSDNEIKVNIPYGASPSQIVVLVESALKGAGYDLFVFEGSLYVVKRGSLLKRLPKGYFSAAGEKEDSSFAKSLLAMENTATSSNKVYRVGTPEDVKKRGGAVVSGYVRNIDSGEPLEGIAVKSSAGSLASVTDSYGYYRLVIPTGEREIRLSGYGMEDAVMKVEVYNDGKLDIMMKEKVYALKGIVVSAESMQNIRGTQIGIEKVRIDRIKKVPSAFGEADVMKIILTLPGVKSVGEASGGFNVRGGATDQNLILFNDGTIYNPTHLFGLFSAFNPDVVNDIELYKSSIPARFGGRISSVLEVNSRDGNSKKVMGSAGLGLLTGRFHLEGPLVKDRTTFILGARTTYSDWILKTLPKESEYKDGTASFRDITFGVNHKLNESNTLYLYGYYSRDGFKFSIDTSYSYRNMNGSAKWRSIFNDKHSMEISAGYNRYDYRTYDKSNSVNSYELDFSIGEYFGKAMFKLLAGNHTLTYGLNSMFYDLAPGDYKPYGSESLVVSKSLEREKAIESALFVADNWSISEKLSLDLGLRYSIFNNEGKTYHNPELRLSGRYIIGSGLSVKAGFNSMSQYIHMLSNTTSMSPTDIWKLSDKNIAPQKGWQAAGGLYASAFGNRAELSLEGYYKKMDHFLDYKSGATLIMNENIHEDVFEANGKAYGVEFMAKKPLGKLNGWLSYTYSRTFLKESGDRGINTINRGDWYPASYDKPHDVKIVANYKFTHRYSISLNVDYATGRPITVPVSKYYYGNGYRFYYSDRNSYRIPDYFRLDLAINIEPSHYLKFWTHSSITIGVYNLTGRKNAYSVYFEAKNSMQIKGYKLSVFGAPIPYINYNIKF